MKLGLDLGQVDVITPDVGGGFGVKINHPWPEELLVPLAARALGRTVKFTEDRREHFISSAHERGQVQHIEVGFDDDGRLLGLDVEFWHDHGAYTPYGLIVPIITSTQLLGPYKPHNYRVVFESLYTNTVMVTPYRGAGRPQGCYAMERTMDAIATYLGKDRTEVRAANFIQPDEFPYDHGLIFQDGRELEYDSGDYPASLEKIKALVGWDEFPAFQAEMAAQGRRVGIGLACYVEGTGVGPYEGAHVHIETSGKVKVATGLTTQGQGHATVFAQLVADELGVRFEDVEVVTGDTRRMPYAVGTFASRAAVMSGSAIHLAAKRAKEKVLRIAAEALEVDEKDLQIVDGVVSVKGAPESSIDLGTVSVLSNPLRYAFDEASKAATQFSVGDPGKPPVAEDDEPGLEGRDFYSPERATFASGMHAVIVETDPETAEIKILKYAVVHDCGNLINPMIVEGQIHGGVAQGVGGALYERMAYDESGQLLNASFMDFLMPYVTEVPDGIDIDHLETPSPLNPLGIKGAGEAGVIPSAAVFAAAIEDAEGSITRIRDHGDADLAVRAVRTSGTRTDRSPHEDLRLQRRRPAGRQGLGRAARPAGPGGHHPGLRAPRGDRRPPVRHDRHRRGRRDQGHLQRLLRALRPQGARVAGDEAPGRRRARHRRRHRRRGLRRRSAARAPGSPTRPTRSSAAWSAASASGCSARCRSGWPASSSATSARAIVAPAHRVGRARRDHRSRGTASSPRPPRPAASRRRTTSSRASWSAPAWSSSAWSSAGSSGGGGDCRFTRAPG